MKSVKILCAVIAAMLIAACSPSPQEMIIGKWQKTTGTPETMQFTPDGKIKLADPENKMLAGETMEGTYEVPDKNTLKIDVGMSVSFYLEFKSKDELMLSADGKSSTYKRVQ